MDKAKVKTYILVYTCTTQKQKQEEFRSAGMTMTWRVMLKKITAIIHAY